MTSYHHHKSLYFHILSLVIIFVIVQPTNGTLPKFQDLVFGSSNNPRRILHQPLFPVSSNPPPPELEPPPPPSTGFPNPDQPFFPEVPAGRTPDQAQVPPVPSNGTVVSNPIATQPSKPTKKVAIAISVGIVTLGMLSGLAFYLYKHRSKHVDESQKLVGGNSQRVNEDSRMPPSTFLYIGTVEPSSQRTVSSSETNGSPYHKLNSIKRSDRYRPSPDLQPLPPLSKPQPPPTMNSPPAMSSSDEESHESTFYTPQGSSVSNEEAFSTSSRRSRSSNKTSLMAQSRSEPHVTSPVPHSKRTSPKSRLSASSPDTKLVIIPSIKQPPPPPPQPPPPPPSAATFRSIKQQNQVQQTSTYAPRRAKFSAPPPAPDLSSLTSESKQPQHTVDTPSKRNPPPPPPLPPLMARPVPLQTPAPSMALPQVTKSSPAPKPYSAMEITESVEEEDNGTNSAEKIDGDDDGSKPKLKPLHWDKVRATSDRATVWDQLKSSSFQVNEDMIESLFGFNSANSSSVPRETPKKSVIPPIQQENRVLDPKKSQNIAILLRALNVTRDEVTEALLDGNPEGLGPELLETLVKMAPTKEEEIKLRDYKGDLSKLGSAERFLTAILDVPFAFKRVEVMLYRANFDTEIKYLRDSFKTLQAASDELKNSRLFLKLLEAVLRTGNRMNVGTNRGDAIAFKLDTLLKLLDIKGTDGKTTLLHFVVQEIIRSEDKGTDSTKEIVPNKVNSGPKEQDFKKQGLHVVAGLGRELGNVKKAAGMDADVLSGYVSKLEMGLDKVRMVLQYAKPDMQGNFFESLKIFLREAEEEIIKIKSEEKKVLSLVKEVTAYFHGDTVKEEAHPFRIFMIVRDFLSILDNVCKEVGRMQDHTVVGSARSFRIPATASLPVLNRYNIRHDRSSDEESSSP
ncbi:hypothetical protein ACET3Z_026979 [Daucus carota]